jgi:hypothetical protein
LGDKEEKKGMGLNEKGERREESTTGKGRE